MMDAQTIITLLIGSGGALGISKAIRLWKPRATADKPVRNGERASILQTLERYEQYFIEHAGTLARIEATAQSSERYLSRRLNDHEDRIVRLEDRKVPSRDIQ